MGRRRLKGQRLPTLTDLLECPDTGWTEMSVDWYDGATRMVQVVSQTSVWYHTGKAPVPIRWVLVRDILHQFQSQVLLYTIRQSARPGSSGGSFCAGRSR